MVQQAERTTERTGKRALRELESFGRKATLTITQVLRQLQRDVRARLKQEDTINEGNLIAVQRDLEALVSGAFTRAGARMRVLSLDSFIAGTELVDDALPLDATNALPEVVVEAVITSGGILDVGSGATFKGGSLQTLFNRALTFNANLVQGLTATARNNVSTLAARAALSDLPMLQIFKEIGPNLSSSLTFKSVAARAQAVARTETLRVYSLATEARMQQAVQVVPDMQKEWVWSGRKRVTHSIADGTRVKVKDNFNVDGEAMAHPRDPAASARNNVNCGCASVPFVPPAKKTKVPAPKAPPQAASKFTDLPRMPGIVDSRVGKIRSLGGGISDTFKGTLANGKNVVIKPRWGQPGHAVRTSARVGKELESERASALIGRKIGIPDVPDVEFRTIAAGKPVPGGRLPSAKPLGESTIMEFKPGDLGTKVLGNFDDLHAYDNADNIAFFDAIIGNSDRHFGNVLVRKTGFHQSTIVPIDHGYAFPQGKGAALMDTGNHKFLAQFAKDKLSTKQLQTLDRMIVEKGSISAELSEAGLNKKQIDLMWQRIEYLRKSKEYPDPGTWTGRGW